MLEGLIWTWGLSRGVEKTPVRRHRPAPPLVCAMVSGAVPLGTRGWLREPWGLLAPGPTGTVRQNDEEGCGESATRESPAPSLAKVSSVSAGAGPSVQGPGGGHTQLRGLIVPPCLKGKCRSSRPFVAWPAWRSTLPFHTPGSFSLRVPRPSCPLPDACPSAVP